MDINSKDIQNLDAVAELAIKGGDWEGGLGLAMGVALGAGMIGMGPVLGVAAVGAGVLLLWDSSRGSRGR